MKDYENQNNDYKIPQRPFKNDSFATRGFPTLFIFVRATVPEIVCSGGGG